MKKRARGRSGKEGGTRSRKEGKKKERDRKTEEDERGTKAKVSNGLFNIKELMNKTKSPKKA